MSIRLTHRQRTLRIVDAAAVGLGMAACLYAIAVVGWVVFHRWRYRYELEWSEGIIAEMVERVMRGQPLYHEPSVDWVPLAYTPLYYYAGAALAAVRGLDLPTLRLVSVAGTCLSLLALPSLLWTMTGDRRSLLVTAGMLAAAFAPSGFWFDVVRGDMLMLGLLCTGAAILYGAESVGRWTFGASALVLAFWCKQPAVFFLAGFGVLAIRRGRRVTLAYGLTAALGVLVPLAVLHVGTSGWSSFCLFTMVSTVARAENVRLLLLDDLLITWWPLLVLCGGWALLPREEKWYTAVLLGAGFTASFGARLRPGGYDNVLLPLQAALITVGVSGAFAIARRLRRCQAFVWLLLGTQVAWTAYSPGAQIPSERDAAFWDAFLVRIGAVPGEVLIPTTAFVQERAGKASRATWLPAQELQRVAPPQARAFVRTLRGRLESGRVGAVVLTEHGAFGMEGLLRGWREVDLGAPGGAGYPVTGWRIRPRWMLLPPVAEPTELRMRTASPR